MTPRPLQNVDSSEISLAVSLLDDLTSPRPYPDEWDEHDTLVEIDTLVESAPGDDTPR
jgi:hypothetical protein